MESAKFYILFGALLFIMAITPGLIKKLPFTSSIIYLLFGMLLGKDGFNLVGINYLEHSKLIEIISEITVIISLFTVGLKLGLPIKNPLWRIPISLATVSMTLTTGMIAALFYYLLGFDLGHSILIGAILSPTDPVLASEVQLKDSRDENRFKFCITAEGGLNDGTAFPFVMLGLGLIGSQGSDWSFSNWVMKDVIWAIFAGLGVGAICGWMIFKISTYVKEIKESFYLEDFLTISSIALSYGIAIQIHSYGFLAVFANALTIRQLDVKTHSQGHDLHKDVLSFNSQLERIFEVISVGMVGLLIDLKSFTWNYVILTFALFFIIRPFAIMVGSAVFKLPMRERHLMAWFGVRGIGSVYYLYYAINHGGDMGEDLIQYTLWIILFSIVFHGSTVSLFSRKLEKSE